MFGELRIDRRVDRRTDQGRSAARNGNKLIKMRVKTNGKSIEKIVPYSSSYTNILEKYFGLQNVEIQRNTIGCIMGYCPNDSKVLYFKFN
ncbi:MAG: hypothetical protein KAQ94_10065 [Arcobacteraceae bacterium]|nr:hypothetical protein [Arcobacteraceae bacterium]